MWIVGCFSLSKSGYFCCEITFYSILFVLCEIVVEDILHQFVNIFEHRTGLSNYSNFTQLGINKSRKHFLISLQLTLHFFHFLINLNLHFFIFLLIFKESNFQINPTLKNIHKQTLQSVRIKSLQSLIKQRIWYKLIIQILNIDFFLITVYSSNLIAGHCWYFAHFIYIHMNQLISLFSTFLL